MKTKYILYLLSLVFLLSSCWKEDLKNCWMGDVTLTIVAEKFQQPATDEGKELFYQNQQYTLLSL